MDFSFLESSIGKQFFVERGGPNKIGGVLRAIKPDYLVMEKENGEIMYVYSEHVKTLTEPVLTEIQMTKVEQQTDPNAPQPAEPVVPIIEAATMKELLGLLVFKLVRINQGGEAVEGVITQVRDDSITVLHNMKDFVHFPIFHIKSLVALYKTTDAKNEADNKKQDGKQDNKNDAKK